MTLSNNAIKFLMAQYRAIFKRAYVKGLATAVLLTAGLAAGQAQAAWPSDAPTSGDDIDLITSAVDTNNSALTSDKTYVVTVSGDVDGSKTHAIASSVDGKNLTNEADIYMTTTSGHSQVLLATSGNVTNNGTIYFRTSGNASAWSSFALFNDGEDNTITNNGTLDVTDAMGMGFSSNSTGSLINESGAVIYATSSGKDNDGAVGMDMSNKGLTSADNAIENYGTIFASGKDAFGMRVADGTTNGTLYNNGVVSATSGAISIAVLDGNDDNDNASTENINIILDTGSQIDSLVVSNGNAINFINNEDDMVFATKEASGGAASTLTLEGSLITFLADESIKDQKGVFSEINLDNSSLLTSNIDIEFTGNNLELTGAQFAGLVSNSGSLIISGAADIVVSDDDGYVWDLTSGENGLGTLTASGTLSTSGDFVISGEGNVSFTAGEVTLGNKFDTDKLAITADVLNVTGAKGNATGTSVAFALTQGSITVNNSLNITSGDTIMIEAHEAESSSTLTLGADSSASGVLNGVDKIIVGHGTKQSGDASSTLLNVNGTWDFNGARLTANKGTININGDVDDVSALQISYNQANVNIAGELTVDRLIGGNSNEEGQPYAGNINITGTLTVQGDNTEEVAGTNGDYANDLSLTTAKVNVKNGGVFDVSADDVQDDFLTITDSNSDGINDTVSVDDEKSGDKGGWVADNVTVEAGGTLKLDLTGVTLSGSTAVESLKNSLIKSGSLGMVDFGGLTYGITADNGVITNEDIVDGVETSQTQDLILDVSTDDTISKSAGVANVQVSGSTLTINNDKTLNLYGDGTLGGEETEKDVTLSSGSTIGIKGNMTVGAITTASGEGIVNVDGGNAIIKSIGTNTNAVDQVNVLGTTSVANVTENIYTDTLKVEGTLTVSGGSGSVAIGDSGADIDGALYAGAVTSSGDMAVGGIADVTSITLANNKNFAVTGKVVADSITMGSDSTSGGNLEVGDEESTGSIVVESLNLNGGMLLIDPNWAKNASFVTVTGDIEKPDAINVSGSIGVGQNSVGVFGATEDEARSSLVSLGLLNNNKLDENGIGAVMYLGETLTIDNAKHVLLDKTNTNTDLKDALTSAAQSSSGSVTLTDGSALVISQSLSDTLVSGGAIFDFAANSGDISVTAEEGSKIIFDSSNIFGGDKVTVATSSGGTINYELSDAKITAANGLLVGSNIEHNEETGTITFTLADDAASKLYNQSAPIKDMTLDVIGNVTRAHDKTAAGVEYIGDVNAANGGAAIEQTSRLAVYGGAVQAALMAQQTSTDAVAERIGMANPNSALITSSNGQGAGLWLAPVYKNSDSDGFDAQGVDYGADIDLYGVALGGDYTLANGVRLGALFNFGSGEADGQGMGSGVTNDFDYYGFTLYSGVTYGNFALTADAGFTQASHDLEQSSSVGKLLADTDTQSFSLGLRAEYLFATPWVDVVPHLGVRYTSLDMDSYDVVRNGTTVATADSDSIQVFSIPFGVTFSKDIAMGDWSVKPVFDINLTANTGDDELDGTTTFVGVPTVALSTEIMDSFTYGTSLGIDAQFKEAFSFGLNVGYTGSSNVDEFGVNANARYTF